MLLIIIIIIFFFDCYLMVNKEFLKINVYTKIQIGKV